MFVSLAGTANCCPVRAEPFAGSFACPLAGLMTVLSSVRMGRDLARVRNILIPMLSEAA
jgi:hypothetical protein